MKKIINGKRYDTDTAQAVANWDNGRYGGDFSAVAETLYLTKSGNWFLHGTGGPMSKYARACGDNSWTGGTRIIPMTADEARKWLEEHDCVSALEEHFSAEIVDA